MALLTLFLTTILLLAIPLTLLRLRSTLRYRRNKPLRHGRRNPSEPTHLMIILGSGGHTTEMLSMLHKAVDPPTKLANTPSERNALRLDWRDYSHRTWVTGTDDAISATRAHDFETFTTSLSDQGQEGLMAGKVKKATDVGPGSWTVRKLPRARDIHQPLATTPWSCVKSFLAAWEMLVSMLPPEPLKPQLHAQPRVEGQAADVPDVILCNGPATAVVVCAVAVVLRFFNYKQCSARGKLRTVYVESWARVKRPSLSGRLLGRVVDRFIVQWPQLEGAAGGKAEYLGVLVG
ncbi:hypothetical protein MBLNU230_g1475t1 [Neophaeotheca triangularis]